MKPTTPDPSSVFPPAASRVAALLGLWAAGFAADAAVTILPDEPAVFARPPVLSAARPAELTPRHRAPSPAQRYVLSLLDIDVPDNSAAGLAHEKTFSGEPGPIASVEVRLTLAARGGEPMFNGDLFVSLAYDTGYAVLLNRPGRRAGSAAGYGDSGFTVSFRDDAPADVHTYRLTLTGSHTTPLSDTDTPAALTGVWQPDGRDADPALVLDTTPRTAMLSSFAGLDPNGTWTLFVADLSEGGLVRLVDWDLEFTPIPEPGPLVLAALIALACLARRRRRA